jgi:hypothetical protein
MSIVLKATRGEIEWRQLVPLMRRKKKVMTLSRGEQKHIGPI